MKVARGYTVHGILQAIILEWVTIVFSRGPSQPKGQIDTRSPTVQVDSLPAELPGMPKKESPSSQIDIFFFNLNFFLILFLNFT